MSMKGLELEGGEVLDLGGLFKAVEGDDEGQSNGDFGGGNGDDEKDEDLAVDGVVGVCEADGVGVIVEAAEGDEGEVGRLEHHLVRHVNMRRLRRMMTPMRADDEEHGRDGQVMIEGDFHGAHTG